MERLGGYLRCNVPRWPHLGGFPTPGATAFKVNAPPWSPLGAVSGSSGALACLANHVPAPGKRRKFLHAPVDSSRNKLSFCFLLVLIKRLNEGATFLIGIFFSFWCSSLLGLFMLGILEKLIESWTANSSQSPGTDYPAKWHLSSGFALWMRNRQAASWAIITCSLGGGCSAGQVHSADTIRALYVF